MVRNDADRLLERPRAGGVLAIWNDIPSHLEVEFNAWYSREHLPERVSIPGFRNGRRFRRAEGFDGPSYFTVYEVDGTDVLKSQPYLDRLNSPTAWTSKMIPLFVNNSRTACRSVASAGSPYGAHLLSVQFETKLLDSGWQDWAAGMLSVLAPLPDVSSAHVYQADMMVTSAKASTVEQGNSTTPSTVDAVFVVETRTHEALAAMRDRLARAVDSRLNPRIAGFQLTDFHQGVARTHEERR